MSEYKVPICVGFIMDGNRRWAKARGMSAIQGHIQGGENLKKIVTIAKEIGIKNIIFYTFSTENWKRSEEEVTGLIGLIGKSIKENFDIFKKNGDRVHFVGDLSRFPQDLQKDLLKLEDSTKSNDGLNIYLALNYGGRQEILSVVKKIIKEGKKEEEITEEYFSKNLQTGNMPDPDIIIRTSGEMRLSGFLPWQGVYSELFFTKTLWPDFSEEEFRKIVEEYGNRERRVGK